MRFKKNIRVLLVCTGINLLLLIAAAGLDIILSSLLLRFSSYAFTIACFAVAGVFSGVFCYSPMQEHHRYPLIWTTILCVLLFLVAAQLSGRAYNWPVKFFAITEMATVLFLWKSNV
ncbi:hypothetical protein [Niabella sp.]|uniref:hypothetical protein n=1 Tax=Niabella sp. TaxID=1962976 RepID=UPI00261FB153|nr:hypothetical protein [Niabella sp.]